MDNNNKNDELKTTKNYNTPKYFYADNDDAISDTQNNINTNDEQPENPVFKAKPIIIKAVSPKVETFDEPIVLENSDTFKNDETIEETKYIEETIVDTTDNIDDLVTADVEIFEDNTEKTDDLPVRTSQQPVEKKVSPKIKVRVKDKSFENNSQSKVDYSSISHLKEIAEPAKKSGFSKFLKLLSFTAIFAIILAGTSIFLADYIIKSTNGEGIVIPSITEVFNGPSVTIINNGSSDTTLPMIDNDNPVILTTPQIAVKVNPSVVGISAETFSGGSQVGTGIIMSDDGYIITNNHVIEYSDVLKVSLYDGKIYEAELIGSDAKSDLAVLKITPDSDDELTTAEFGNSDALVVGDIAIAIGNPGGLELQGTFTGGYISAINRDILVDDRLMTLIQTDASISPGNSGGPLINHYGQVIGINTIKISAENYEGLGFAIPINQAKPILDELIEFGYVRGRPSIGISGINISKETAYFNDLPQGLLVKDVDTRSDAYKKGLKANDIIVGINGEEALDITAINKIKDQFKAGEKITLNVYRAGKEIDIEIILMDEMELQLQVPTDKVEEPNTYVDPYSNNDNYNNYNNDYDQFSNFPFSFFFN